VTIFRIFWLMETTRFSERIRLFGVNCLQIFVCRGKFWCQPPFLELSCTLLWYWRQKVLRWRFLRQLLILY